MPCCLCPLARSTLLPPNRDLEALELPTDSELQLDFIKDFLCQLIQYYYSPLAVRATLLFSSQRAMSVCVHYPIPVGHCQ